MGSQGTAPALQLHGSCMRDMMDQLLPESPADVPQTYPKQHPSLSPETFLAAN